MMVLTFTIDYGNRVNRQAPHLRLRLRCCGRRLIAGQLRQLLPQRDLALRDGARDSCWKAECVLLLFHCLSWRMFWFNHPQNNRR